MKVVYIEVEEHPKDRTPLFFYWNNKKYIVLQADMCSLQVSKTGKLAIPVICKVENINKQVTIWLSGDKWFVEIE